MNNLQPTASTKTCFYFCIGHGPFSHAFDNNFIKKVVKDTNWTVIISVDTLTDKITSLQKTTALVLHYLFYYL